MQLAAEAVAGDIAAITPYLKVLDRLDRYQTVASANQGYDEEDRRKLMDKINRVAENFGINEAFAAAVHEHLKKQGVVFDDEVSVSDGGGADMASETEEATEASTLEAARLETEMSSNYFL